MEVPPGLKYSKEHEWVATEESVATIGITDPVSYTHLTLPTICSV